MRSSGRRRRESRRVDPARLVPLAQPAAVAAAVILGCALLASVDGRAGLTTPGETGSASEPAKAGSISVRITPPAYTARPIEMLTDPVQVTTIAGSRVRIESGSRVLREWVAVESASLELRGTRGPAGAFLVRDRGARHAAGGSHQRTRTRHRSCHRDRNTDHWARRP